MKARSIVSCLVAGILLATFVPPAHARVVRHVRHRDTVIIRDRHHHHHHDAGAAIAGGIITGVVVGAVAGSVAGAAKPPQTVVVTVPVLAPGTIVSGLPSGCASVVVGPITYFDCAGVYYQPLMTGRAISYKVVAPPR